MLPFTVRGDVMWRVVKIIAAVWLVFILIALADGGGDLYRSLSVNAGRNVETLMDIIADKSDSIHADALVLKEKMKKLFRARKGIARSDPAKSVL